MKHLIYLAGLVTLLFSSCDREIYPHARFSVNYNLVQPDEMVYFTSQSTSAIRHYWDFGDGTVSDAVHPAHAYHSEGVYTVTLSVESRDGNMDMAKMQIEVVYTALEIEVAEWNPSRIVQYLVPGAWVALYETLEDWETDSYRVVEGYADSDGVITFLGLDAIPYYVYAELNDYPNRYDQYSNWQMSNDDIRTQTLTPFAFNFWRCWTYYNPSKSLAKREPRTAVMPLEGEPSIVKVNKGSENQ